LNRNGLPCPEVYPAANSLFEFPPAEKFFSGGAEKLAVLSSWVELRTQEIDAKSITAEKFTPGLADKETGLRDFSPGGQ